MAGDLPVFGPPLSPLAPRYRLINHLYLLKLWKFCDQAEEWFKKFLFGFGRVFLKTKGPKIVFVVHVVVLNFGVNFHLHMPIINVGPNSLAW